MHHFLPAVYIVAQRGGREVRRFWHLAVGKGEQRAGR